MGKVYLVGAGPGDEELLTIKGQRVLACADVVVYDRLVGDGILDMIPGSAERIDVGKNAGSHPVPQEQINQLLAEKAAEDKNVVRLKGGDSFLFGRGGEELILLCEKGISFEVVPGISSAIAAPAYAGIPVTHRDFCSSLHIMTGHKKNDAQLMMDYESLVRMGGTLVFMMSVSSIGDILKGLQSAGMDKDMECAVIENGTKPSQRKLITTLGKAAEDIKEAAIGSPAIVVVGKVCSFSNKLDWFSALPLKGLHILVTRPKPGAARLASGLKQLGADAVLLPSIKTQDMQFEMPNLNAYTMLIFTSVNGVDAFFSRLFEKADARTLADKRVAAVGRETAKALLEYGIRADFVPSVYSGDWLGKELIESGSVTKSDRLLILRAKVASVELTDRLKKEGILFDEVPVYETLFEENQTIDFDGFDFVTFTSASCVEGFMHTVRPCNTGVIKAVCIGNQTAQAAAKYGMNVAISDAATIESMIDKITELAGKSQEGRI